jgi:signal peptidase II
MKIWHSAVIILFLLSIDLLSKIWVRANILLYDLTTLIPNLIDLTHVRNRGVSFSFLSDLDDTIRLPLLIGISVVAIAGMIFYQLRYWEEFDEWTKQGLTWILPGAMGNLVDRSWFGYVTDFFHFRWYEISFFVNNLADIFISFGVVCFVISSLPSVRSVKA